MSSEYLNSAQQLLQTYYDPSKMTGRDYKSLHAYRGTPKRKHFVKDPETRLKQELAYYNGVNKPQPDKYKNSSRTIAEV